MVLHGCSLGLPNLKPALHFARLGHPKPHLPYKPTLVGHPKPLFPLVLNPPKKIYFTTSFNALQGPDSPKEEQGYPTEPPPEGTDTLQSSGSKEQKPEPKRIRVGEEKGKNGGGILTGVAEEIQQIEWPVFGKVLGTTGVVLAVIAGSSVVLLTVNAVLAEISDRVFAGKGVQDFFG